MSLILGFFGGFLVLNGFSGKSSDIPPHLQVLAVIVGSVFVLAAVALYYLAEDD